MGRRYPAEFRQRAVELARQREKPLRQLAADLGVSDQTLHNWVTSPCAKPRPARAPSRETPRRPRQMERSAGKWWAARAYTRYQGYLKGFEPRRDSIGAVVPPELEEAPRRRSLDPWQVAHWAYKRRVLGKSYSTIALEEEEAIKSAIGRVVSVDPLGYIVIPS